MIVVFRDPRDVIVSEHRMKIDFFNEDVGELEPYIRSRFEVRMVTWGEKINIQQSVAVLLYRTIHFSISELRR